MRRDEEQRIKEQRMTLVQELRTTASAADTWKAENHEVEWRQEDKEKFEKIEKDILSINQSLEQHTPHRERWPAGHPRTPSSYSGDGAPKTLDGRTETRTRSSDVGSARGSPRRLQVDHRGQGGHRLGGVPRTLQGRVGWWILRADRPGRLDRPRAPVPPRRRRQRSPARSTTATGDDDQHSAQPDARFGGVDRRVRRLHAVGRDDHQRHPLRLQGRHEDHRVGGAPDRHRRST